MTEPHPPPPPPSTSPHARSPSPPLLLSLPLSQTQIQARVAAVIYDAILRGGPSAHSLTTQLSAAYPTSAAIAHQYLSHTHAQFNHHLPLPHFHNQLPSLQQPAQLHSVYGAHFERHHRGFILRRIDVSSIAWFCFLIGSLLASLRICFIFTLALAATLARVADNDNLYEIIDNVASQCLGNGPLIELYQWLFAVLTEQDPTHIFVQANVLAVSYMLPSYIAAAILLTPVTAGMLCFCLGGLAAVVVNFALRVAGGIRFQSYDD